MWLSANVSKSISTTTSSSIRFKPPSHKDLFFSSIRSDPLVFNLQLFHDGDLPDGTRLADSDAHPQKRLCQICQGWRRRRLCGCIFVFTRSLFQFSFLSFSSGIEIDLFSKLILHDDSMSLWFRDTTSVTTLGGSKSRFITSLSLSLLHSTRATASPTPISHSSGTTQSSLCLFRLTRKRGWLETNVRFMLQFTPHASADCLAVNHPLFDSGT